MKTKDKIILVSGAGRGLGRELTLQLLARGAKVAALDIDEKSLSETVGFWSGPESNIKTYVIDITAKEIVANLPAQVIKDFGAIDGIINNAGIIQPFRRVKDLDYQTINRVMNINFFGALYMTKSFLPYLLKRSEAHIVNVSSMGGFLPVPAQSVYGASKAALKLLTEGLYSELLDTNVRVSIVFPGAMATNIAVNSGVENSLQISDSEQTSFKPLPAAVGAKIVIAGIEKNAFRILVGPDAKFMDFLCRLNPQYAARYIYKKMKSLLPK